ncbi:WD40-repeat-containing domain protein [Favolaschia claudopus]|uniref:WD40-repeat-containing domain protein n=1 Tax=Favolaschia claudopus TaxID=2862362 RepID=A0AAW0C2F4_9AGAR
MAFFSSNSNAAANNGAPKDIEVADPPSDSISSLAFSNQADFIAAGSWDNNVRVYEVGPGGKTQGKAMYSHQGPVLSVCWSQDGSKIFSGGADNAARMFDTGSGQPQQVAQHDAPVKAVRWVDTPQGGILATGSWDKTLKYWDLRTSNPIATVQLPERCYSMDVHYPFLVVGTAERHIQVFEMSNPTTVFKSVTSPLAQQTRVVSCFKASAKPGFAAGSVEGRAAFQYFEEKDAGSNFSFRCHRNNDKPNETHVFAVNDISFHPVHGTFSTCGSDGTFCFWDKDARSRLKAFNPAPGPISSSAFNRDGSIFAYSVAYDWSKGHSGMTPGHPNKIMLHACTDEEVKKRPAKR